MAPVFGTRLQPQDDKHLRKYPYSAKAKGNVEFAWPVPAWASSWNQRNLDACVGFASCMALSVVNEAQAKAHKNPPYTRVYDAVSLWWTARLTDEFADNDNLADPHQGTTIRAALEVLRTTGPKLIQRGVAQAPDPAQGIKEYRWGSTLDHLRAAVANRQPCVIGIEAWQGLGEPVKVGDEWYVGDGIPGWKRGLYIADHALPIVGASDEREAVLVVNSWAGPAFWMTYKFLESEFKGKSEIAIVTDKPTP